MSHEELNNTYTLQNGGVAQVDWGQVRAYAAKSVADWKEEGLVGLLEITDLQLD